MVKRRPKKSTIVITDGKGNVHARVTTTNQLTPLSRRALKKGVLIKAKLNGKANKRRKK